MILIDIFHLLMSMGEKILNKPDQIIEYYDKDLQVLGDSKEFMKLLVDTLPVDPNGLKYPNSEAQKRLKAITDLWNDIVEFEKYMENKAADARERERAMLIAMAVFEALLSHQAMVSEFWDKLSDQYIQYLQNRLQSLSAMLEKVDTDIVKLNYEIHKIQERIDAYDKNIEKEMGDLIKVAQERVDAVSSVVNDSYNNHLENLGDLNQHLANFVVEKEAIYIQAVEKFEAFHKAHPAAEASALEAFIGAVNASKQDFTKASDLLGMVEKTSKNMAAANHEFNAQRANLDLKLQAAAAPKEKYNLIQEREQFIKQAVSTHKIHQNEINDIRKHFEIVKKDIGDMPSNFNDLIFKMHDSHHLIENADQINLSKFNVAAQSISDKMKMKDKLILEKETKLEELGRKMSEKEDILSQSNQTKSYLTQFKSETISSRLSPKELFKANIPPPAEPTPFRSSYS